VHIYAEEKEGKGGGRGERERERESRVWLPPLNHFVGTLTANGAKYLAKYLHDKYVCPVTEILLSELMEAVAKRSVHSPFLFNRRHPRPPPVIANIARKVLNVNKLLFLARGRTLPNRISLRSVY